MGGNLFLGCGSSKLLESWFRRRNLVTGTLGEDNMLETAWSVSRERRRFDLAATWGGEERHICTGRQISQLKISILDHLRSMPRQVGNRITIFAFRLGTARDEVPGTTLLLINTNSRFPGLPEASVVQRTNSIRGRLYVQFVIPGSLIRIIQKT